LTFSNDPFEGAVSIPVDVDVEDDEDEDVEDIA